MPNRRTHQSLFGLPVFLVSSVLLAWAPNEACKTELPQKLLGAWQAKGEGLHEEPGTYSPVPLLAPYHDHDDCFLGEAVRWTTLLGPSSGLDSARADAAKSRG